jgi:hypothetical protein
MICVKRRRQYQRVARDLCEKEKTASVCNTRVVWNDDVFSVKYTSRATHLRRLLRYTQISCYKLTRSSLLHTNLVLLPYEVFIVTRWCSLLRSTQISCYTLMLSSPFHTNLVLHADTVFSVSHKSCVTRSRQLVTRDLCVTEKTT